MNKEIITRLLSLREDLSIFSDCGHNADGFSHGNTCGSLRGRNSYGGKEFHESRSKHHDDRISKLSQHKKMLEDKIKRLEGAIQKSEQRSKHHKKMLKSDDPKQEKSKSGSMSRDEGLKHLNKIQESSASLDSKRVDEEIDKLSGMSTSELKEVQKEFLGAVIGKNKQEMISYIKKAIQDYRRSNERVEGISKMRKRF